jgi:hypothetical protein
MSQRNYASGGKIYSMHVKPVMVTATIQIGASGSVSSMVGSMVASAVHVGTGIYKIVCQANTSFSRLYFAAGTMQSASGGLSGILGVEVQNAPNTSVATSGGMELTVRTLDAAGAAANPASGSALNIIAILSDSSVLIGGE